MRRRGAVLSLLAGLLSAPCGPAQSLGEVAQREGERRARLKAEGRRSTPVVDEQGLKANKGELANDPSAAPAAAGSPPARTAPRPGPGPELSTGISWPEAETGQSGPQPQEVWRQRMAQARASLERMTRQYEQLAGAHLAPGEYFVDPRTGENLIGGAARLQELVAAAKQEQELARQRLEALEERARRERVPPGWLR